MARQTSKGKCELCSGTFSKSGMSKHLATCRQKKIHEEATGGAKVSREKAFHLVVEGREAPEYWMHLEVPSTATLQTLDYFLRDEWLECCGHLSAFTIADQEYTGEPEYFAGPLEAGEKSMDVELRQVLRPRMKFLHEYDFGTTTELTLRVISEGPSVFGEGDVGILARNDAPEILCGCGKVATQVCSQCIWDGDGWLCEDCAADHECGEDMLLPVVNSPRVGMCAYSG